MTTERVNSQDENKLLDDSAPSVLCARHGCGAELDKMQALMYGYCVVCLIDLLHGATNCADPRGFCGDD